MGKRILFYVNHIGNSQTARQGITLAKCFVKLGHEVRLVTNRNEKREYEIPEGIIRLETLSEDAKKGSKELKNYIQDLTDIVMVYGSTLAKRVLDTHVKSVKIILIDFAFPGEDYERKHSTGKRKISEIFHFNVNKAEKNKNPIGMVKKIYQEVDGIALSTKECLTFWKEEEHLAEDILNKCSVMPVFLGEQYWKVAKEYKSISSKYNQQENKQDPVIAYVGTIQEGSGHMALVKAFEKLLETYPNGKLKLYGASSSKLLQKQLMELIRSHNLTEKMEICLGDDWEDSSKLITKRLQDVDVFVYPSVANHIPIIAMEAMLLGIPVLVSDNADGGAREFIEDGFNGLLFQAGNEDELFIALKKYVDYPEEASRIALEAQKIEERYSEKRICEQWSNILE